MGKEEVAGTGGRRVNIVQILRALCWGGIKESSGGVQFTYDIFDTF
jgi:hypothetical protein